MICMNIAIDMRSLEGASFYRGIGVYLTELSTLLIPELLKKNHQVTLYTYDQESLAFMSATLKESCRIIEATKTTAQQLPQPLQKMLNGVVSNRSSAEKLPELSEVDVFFQPYYALGVPKNVTSVAVCYDLIPLIFGAKHFNKPLTPSPLSWLLRLRSLLQKRTNMKDLLELNNATKVLAISEHTKQTLVDYLSFKPENITVTLLGSPSADISQDPKTPTNKPYIAYVGGIDNRRDITGLLQQAESLYVSEGIQTVVAGNDFSTTSNQTIKQLLADGKARKAVINLGYIAEAEKYSLLAGALAFVYPTKYEGFGLPLLEAFVAKTPVITYKNSSLQEVGGDAALFADTPETMSKLVSQLAHNPDLRKKHIDSGLKRAKLFTWNKTAKTTADALVGAKTR